MTGPHKVTEPALKSRALHTELRWRSREDTVACVTESQVPGPGPAAGRTLSKHVWTKRVNEAREKPQNSSAVYS